MNAAAIAKSTCHRFTNVRKAPCPLFRPSTGCALTPFLGGVRVPSREEYAQHCGTPHFRDCCTFRIATSLLAPLSGIDWWCRGSADRRDLPVHASGECPDGCSEGSKRRAYGVLHPDL